MALSQAPVCATLPFDGLGKADGFYSEKLGLKRISGSADEGYLLYEAGSGSTIMLFESDSKKSEDTAATFNVSDLDMEVAELKKKGVTFEEYDLPGIKTINGVAQMGEMRGAWVKDPGGNILSIMEAK